MTQFGNLELSQSPGQPEKSITTGTPSFSASWIGLAADFLIVLSPRLIRMQRIAVAAQRADGEAVVRELLFENIQLPEFSSMDSLQCGSPG